jgi:hypothetical protein
VSQESAPLCGCGCGNPVQSARAQFIRGHRARVVWRDGVLVPRIRERQLCICGCGQQVNRLRGTFIRGHTHAPMSDAGKARMIEKRRTGSWRICPYPGCNERRLVKLYRDAKWKACSRAHFMAMRRNLQPWNALQVECLRWINANNSSVTALARALDCSRGSLDHWFNTNGATVRGHTIERLADLLGITVEQAITMAGGLTAEEKLATAIAAVSRSRPPEQRREHAAHAGRASKGKKASPEAIASRRAGMIRTGAAERNTAIMVAAAKSDKGRASHSLFIRLRLQPHPSLEQAQAWAKASAARLGLDVDFIMLVWKPYLEIRGARPITRRGRPALKERCLQLRQLMADWPWTGEGRAPKGFDPAFGALIGLSYNAAREWRTRHHPCELACPKTRQRVKKQSR